MVRCVHSPFAIKVNEQGTIRQPRWASQARSALNPRNSAILEVEHWNGIANADRFRPCGTVDQAIGGSQSGERR